VPLGIWLKRNGVNQATCGLAAVSNIKNTYALFTDGSGRRGFGGIVKHGLSQDVTLSSIPKGLEPATVLYVNTDGYSRYCKEYQEYWEWVKQRNETRYRNTLSNGKNYDAKNMMHTFRLLDIAEEIARTGRFTTRRPNREDLIKIKSGIFEYDELMKRAHERLIDIKELFDHSTLPAAPDIQKVDNLLVTIRERLYAEWQNIEDKPQER
jgi:hypothetical protein